MVSQFAEGLSQLLDVRTRVYCLNLSAVFSGQDTWRKTLWYVGWLKEKLKRRRTLGMSGFDELG